MKELQLNIVFFPQSVNYGLAGTNRLQNIIHYLRLEGIDSIANVALLDKPANGTTSTAEPFVKDYNEVFYGPSAFHFVRHIFKTIKYLNSYNKKGYKNVIYFYGEVDIKNFFFLKWARLVGYKIVIDVVEDLEAFKSFKSFKNKLKYKSAVFFRKRLSGYANGFTVVSTHLYNKLNAAYPQIPSFFLPVTINKHLLAFGGIRDANQKSTIFYSGSFNEKDGLPYLLAALHLVAEANKQFRLVLSGQGTDNEMNKFWQDVTRYQLEDNIDYRGFLSRNAYITLLAREADILCMTRINSAYANAGFPFKLGEFLATGKPVIASTIGDVHKYLTTDDAYLVPPENSMAIKNAIIDIMEKPEAADGIGKRGKQAAMRFFDHELYALPLKEFIAQI